MSILNNAYTAKKYYEYDSYGKAEEKGATDFINENTFTGAIAEGDGIYYMNARFYDANTGRFLSQDTYKGNAYEPWSQNLYSYCGNNPVNYVDPTGHFREKTQYIEGGGRTTDPEYLKQFFAENAAKKAAAERAAAEEAVRKLEHERMESLRKNALWHKSASQTQYGREYYGAWVFPVGNVGIDATIYYKYKENTCGGMLEIKQISVYQGESKHYLTAKDNNAIDITAIYLAEITLEGDILNYKNPNVTDIYSQYGDGGLYRRDFKLENIVVPSGTEVEMSVYYLIGNEKSDRTWGFDTRNTLYSETLYYNIVLGKEWTIGSN